jgi:succinate dehydrogenase/fumarate reductase flavoprotein subunit
LEDHRAVELLPTLDGDGVARSPFVDIRRGTFLVVWAKAVLLATGTGPTLYEIMAPSAEKTSDGMAMAYRIGARCVDMEMVQFHPTGLLMGESGMHGTVLGRACKAPMDACSTVQWSASWSNTTLSAGALDACSGGGCRRRAWSQSSLL